MSGERVYLTPGGVGPAGTPGITANWLGAWQAGRIYAAGPPPDGVISPINGHWYVSLTDDNVGHEPTTDGGVHWADMTPPDVAAAALLLPSGGDDTAAINAANRAKKPLGPGTFHFSDVIYGCPLGVGAQGEDGSALTNLVATSPYAQIQHGGGLGGSQPQVTGEYGNFNVDGQSIAALLKPPASAPTLIGAATGGTLAAGVYQVKVSYVNAQGETTVSPPASITLSGSTSKLTINAPPPQADATGWRAYVTQPGGPTFIAQQSLSAPVSIQTTSLVLTAPPSSSGDAPPATNTALSTLFMSNVEGAMYQNIRAYRPLGDGGAVYGQNCLFENCVFPGGNTTADPAGNNGLVLDGGTGGNVFSRCEFPGAKKYDLDLRQSPGISIGYGGPALNYFYGCIFEGFVSGLAALRLGISANNVFDGCTIFMGGSAQYAVYVDNQGLGGYPNFVSGNIFRATGFGGGTIANIGSATGDLFSAPPNPPIILGHGCLFGGAPVGINWRSSRAMRIDAPVYSQCATFFQRGPGAADLQFGSLVPLPVYSANNATALGVSPVDAQQRLWIPSLKPATPYQQSVLARTGLLAYVPLFETANSSVAHELLAANDGAYGGAVPGHPALKTDSSPSAGLGPASAGLGVTLPNVPAFQPTTGLTAVAWVNVTTVGADGIELWVAGNFDSVPNHGWILYLEAFSGACVVGVTAGTANVSTPPLSPGVHQIAGTWDGTTVRSYVDGLLAGSTAFAGPIGTGAEPVMGYLPFGGTTAADVSDFALYDRALSDAELAQDYATGVAVGAPFAWKAMTLGTNVEDYAVANSWGNGTLAAAIQPDRQTVRLRGVFAGTAALTSGATIATLPSDCAPAQDQLVNGAAYLLMQAIPVLVHGTTGVIALGGSGYTLIANTPVGLDAITIPRS